jgi:hypothetical protein
VTSLLRRRGALRVRGDHGPSARDAQPSRAFLLRGVLQLPYDVVLRARDAPLPCDDAPLPSFDTRITFLFSN